MKKHIHIISLIALLATMTFYSCQKDTGESDAGGTIAGTGNSKISFSVQGMASRDDQSEKKLSTNARKSKGPRIIASKRVNLGQVDAQMTITETSDDLMQNPRAGIKSSVASRASGENSAERFVSTLVEDTKYRVVLYNADESGNPTTLHDQAEGTIGSNKLVIAADRGKKYRWYAYTYNSEGEIPAFNDATGIIPIMPSGNNDVLRQDFGYATGVITTNMDDSQPNLISDIVFTRKTARFVIEYNSRGIFSGITMATPRFESNKGMQKANFRLKDSTLLNFSGDLSGLSVYNGHGRSYRVPVGTDSVTIPNSKHRFAFFSPVNGSSPVALTITTDTIRAQTYRLDEITGEEESMIRGVYNTSFSFPAFTPEAGKSYLVSIKIIESAIRIGTTYWARGNIYRDADGPGSITGISEYFFRFDNPLFEGLVVPYTDYFTDDIYDVDRGKNICELVYPEDTWDLPTVAQFEELAAHTNKEIYQDPNNNWDVEFTSDDAVQGWPFYRDELLEFVPVGYRSIFEGPILQFFPSSVSYASTKGYWRTKTPTMFAVMNYTTVPSLIVTPAPGLSGIYTSVRCVRKN